MAPSIGKAIGLAAAAIALGGCLVGLQYVRTADGGRQLFPSSLLEQVSFEHGCPPDRLVLLRVLEDRFIYDLDVCGRVRRYRCVGHWTCADTTASFPPDALPFPVQPPGGATSPPAPQVPAGPRQCQTSADCDRNDICIERWCRRR
jgi:hypothetical protein